MEKIISFGTLKGGTGKTTTVFSVAAILSEKGYKVLAIDVDPQANLTSNMNVDEMMPGYKSIKDLYECSGIPPQDVIIKSPISKLPNLDLIGSTISLTSTEMKIISYPKREYILSNYFKSNSQLFEMYDFIIFDTNPSMSILNQNCFFMSDGIILVTDIGVNSLRGLEVFIAIWEDILNRVKRKTNIKGIIINKYDQTSSISKEFIEYVREDSELKNLIFKTYIPYSKEIPESELESEPINVFDKKSKAFKAYNDFADELINRL